MNCPSCQHSNRDGARFCEQCGAPLPPACPVCGTVARPGARFCDNCGAPLTAAPQAAPPIQAPAPVEASAQTDQHVDSAGLVTAHAHPVSAAQPAYAPEVRRFIPPALLAKLEAARASGGMVGERRVVTMLFCDVKGSTAAAERLDPEEWAEIMNGAFEHLIAPVYHYEGTLARMMGDAILAFFGAPIAHEDDAQRAVLAGLGIVQGLQPYRAQVRQRWGIDFDVRVGINTGLVMVGPVGSDLHMEYTALGDAINLASRMEQAAQPGTVQIAAATYRLVAPLFDVLDLGRIPVKGRDEPVLAYRVLASKGMPGRLRGVAGLYAPLTGRDDELGRLRRALDEALQGRGQIIHLAGEAGLGKSRLVRELRAVWENTGSGAGRWCEAASVSYETGQPYGLFQRLVRNACGATEAEAPDALRVKLAGLLPLLGPEQRARAQSVLASLFGLARSADEAPLHGETFRHQLFALIPALIEAWATQGPVVLVFEDLHWADPASVALLEHLFPLTQRLRLLLVCVLRPDPQAPSARLLEVAERDHAERLTRVEVRPLTSTDSALLVDALLARAELPEALRRRILARAEGNPFFVEEVLRALIDRGVLVPAEASPGPRWVVGREAGQAEIPESLQSLLTARIDRLGEAARRTLQVAAIIGRTFQYDVLCATLQGGPQLDERLAELQAANLVYEVRRQPALEYAFRHALVQEAAYQTILRRHRREFHRRVGEALEMLFPDQLDLYAPALGFHFDEAGDALRALRYTTLAGDAAFRLYANAEAIGHYTRALDLAQRNGAPADVFRHLYQRRGRALELNAQYREALDNYAALEALGQQRGEPALVLEGVMGQGVIHAMGTTAYADPERAAAALDRALGLAQSLGDHAAQARIHWARLQAHGWTLDAAAAAAEGERSLALARAHGLTEQRAYTLTDLGILYYGAVGLQRSSELLDEAVPLWRQLNNQPLLANSLSFVATLRTHAGEADQAIAASDEAYELTASIGNWWGMAFSRMTVGLAYWDRGEPGQAVALLQDALRNAERAGFNVPLFGSNAFLAAIYGSLGAEAQARAVLAQVPQQPAFLVNSFRPLLAALEIALPLYAGDLERAEAAAEAAAPILEGLQSYFMRGTGNFLLGLLGSIRCQLALARGRLDESQQSAEHFLALARQVQEGRDLPGLLYWRGRALLGLGQLEAARASLDEARALAQPAPARRVLWRVDLALAELEAGAGRAAEASALRRSARDHLTYIADHAGSPDLRASFLARPAVRAAMSDGPREP